MIFKNHKVSHLRLQKSCKEKERQFYSHFVKNPEFQRCGKLTQGHEGRYKWQSQSSGPPIPVRKTPGLLPTCSIPNTQYCGASTARRMTPPPPLSGKCFSMLCFHPKFTAQCVRAESAGACLGDNHGLSSQRTTGDCFEFPIGKASSLCPLPLMGHLVRLIWRVEGWLDLSYMVTHEYFPYFFFSRL